MERRPFSLLRPRFGLRAAIAAGLLLTAPVSRAAPPTPTPAQVAALGELQKEADTYEKAARDYRGVLGRIVQHHYEDRRRRVLAALDAEIAVEKRGLRDARAEAIRKLEAFIAGHSGPNAHPEKTPDAMFRLAALYEERARTDLDSSDDLAAGLEPAVALYKRIIREFPRYRELAGVFYYLGHAYNDASRVAEAQQVFRSLVCHDRYPYPTAPDPKDPRRDSVGRLPQDHDRAYWQAWSPPRRGKAGEEATFKNPFPADCKAIPQTTEPGQEPRYLAEVWWLIGDHHFSESDPASGPYALNRAEAAYRRSLEHKKPPVHGVAMYKLAWTYFKQQRYEASVRQFVELLRYADEQQKRTGDPGADFRAEAYTYIAGALTYLDFKGPDPDEPRAARNDVLDTETDGRVAEQKMRVAIDRVQDARLIPQDQRWSVDIYRALARELADLKQLHNLIELDEIVLKKWPMHRDAPVVQNEIAEAWEKLAALSREGTRERAEAMAKALDARTKLAAYVGNKPWPDAHKDDPEAIHAAERLARGGLQRAAADHTNMGSALFEKGIAIADKPSRDRVLEQALAEYRLAAQAWSGLPKEEGAPDAYERRFWEADAHHKIVTIAVALDRSPTPAEIDAARRSALAVRDSNEDDKYFQPAAFMMVDIAQQVLNDRHKLFARTGGREGIEPRREIKTAGAGSAERVVSEPLPREVAEAIAARDEYVQRVSPARDTPRNAPLYAYQAADTHFLYGQLDEAKKRLVPIHQEGCQKTEQGFLAWRRLLTMAALTHDAEQVRTLAKGALDRSCAVNGEHRVLERKLALEALGAADYEDARTVFERAQKMPDGPERAAAWRKAAALYGAMLDKTPDGDAAPEAAINGAYAYKQVGDYEQAIGLYERFVRAYGNDEKLDKLQKSDASKYVQRIGFLTQAHDGLSRTYLAILDVRRAAGSFDAVAKNARLSRGARREAAHNAAVLHARAGDQERMTAARAAFLALDPPADQRAELDWLVAEADLKAWDERGLDENGNRAARLKAMSAMETYHAASKKNPAANAYVVRAAYHAAKLARAARDPKADAWRRETVAAFERLRAASPVVEGRSKALGTAEAEMAAEHAFGLLDDKIKNDLGKPRYEGSIDKVMAAYRADLKKAEAHHEALQSLITAYQSPAWSVAARARQGSLYDACRTGLYFARAPGLKLFTDKEERLLTQLTRINPDAAEDFKQKRFEDWRAARERELAEADQVMVRRYAEAVIWARAWKVQSPAVDGAIQRLAGFTNLLGDAKLRQYSQGITDPATKQPFVYEDGFFLRSRPGLPLALSGEALPAPMPVKP